MFVSLISLLLAAEPPSADIVVLANKLREAELDLRFGREDGVLFIKRCELVSSSGDSDADKLGCRAAQDCASRQLKKKAEMRACTKSRALELLDELVEERTRTEAAL